MKKIFYFTILCSMAVFTFSCAKEKKVSEKPATTASYKVDHKNSSVQWIAYKTTDKLPVKGTFTEIDILKSAVADKPVESLNGLEFSIPVSSIYSKDTIRDGKLNTFFFAVMEKTSKLHGVFKVVDASSGKLDLTMNGMTKELPFEYKMDKDNILIQATLDLKVWETESALESLHKACMELHTGPDGISKTWDEVSITAKIVTVEN